MPVKEKPKRGPCLNPRWLNHTKDGPKARCRKCATCRTMRIDDWVGRARAEAMTSLYVEVLTLTYGDGNDPYGTNSKLHSQSLYPRDLQDFWKRLRKRGSEFKYIACGELGTLKGRAHWHAIVFYTKKPHDWGMRHTGKSWPVGKKPKGREFLRDGEQDVWKHGHVYVDANVQHKAFQYVLKYIHKDESHEARFSFSKGIGKHWMLENWAQQFVNDAISPVDNRYSFAIDRMTDRTRKAWQYRMHKGVTAKFVRSFIDKWDAQRPGHPLKKSQWLLDRLAETEPDYMGHPLKPKRYKMVQPKADDIPPDLRGPVDRPLRPLRWSEHHNSFYLDCPKTGRLWWCATEEGTFGWSHGISGVSGALIAARRKAEHQIKLEADKTDPFPEPWQHVPEPPGLRS